LPLRRAQEDGTVDVFWPGESQQICLDSLYHTYFLGPTEQVGGWAVGYIGRHKYFNILFTCLAV